MEEKERYIYHEVSNEVEHYECYWDNKEGCELFDDEAVLNRLNEQDFELKKLNQENIKLIEENQQLKQQLHDLPKKIVEYFYDEIRHRAILEDDYCPDHNLERKYGVRKCLLENIRSTVLKKYGGEDE